MISVQILFFFLFFFVWVHIFVRMCKKLRLLWMKRVGLRMSCFYPTWLKPLKLNDINYKCESKKIFFFLNNSNLAFTEMCNLVNYLFVFVFYVSTFSWFFLFCITRSLSFIQNVNYFLINEPILNTNNCA